MKRVLTTCGHEIRIEQSRKSAVPADLPGGHYIVSIYKDGDATEPLTEKELISAEVLQALEQAMVFGQENSNYLGARGCYRLSFNGQGFVRRPHFHIHVVVLGVKQNELADVGYELVQLVSPDSLVRKSDLSVLV